MMDCRHRHANVDTKIVADTEVSRRTRVAELANGIPRDKMNKVRMLRDWSLLVEDVVTAYTRMYQNGKSSRNERRSDRLDAGSNERRNHGHRLQEDLHQAAAGRGEDHRPQGATACRVA